MVENTEPVAGRPIVGPVEPWLRAFSEAPAGLSADARAIVCDWFEANDDARLRPLLDACLWADEISIDGFGVRASFRVAGVSYPMRWVPAGEFEMGDDRLRSNPPHRVRLTRSFWLGETPITRRLLNAISPEDGLQGGNPAAGALMDWRLGVRVARALSWLHPHLTVRLPTEAEWEAACRAGTSTENWLGGPERLAEIAWYSPADRHAYHPAPEQSVGRKAPNPLGLYDMLGYLRESCADGWALLNGERAVDPVAPITSRLRVHRGGSLDDPARHIYAASRWQKAWVDFENDQTVRLAMSRQPYPGEAVQFGPIW